MNRERRRAAMRKHAVHDQADHGNWARGGGGPKLTVSQNKAGYMTWTSDDFPNPQAVKDYIAEQETTRGGAWSFSSVFGQVDIVRADTPSKVPDDYIGLTGSPRQVYWKGKWQDFSSASRARESMRGLGEG